MSGSENAGSLQTLTILYSITQMLAGEEPKAASSGTSKGASSSGAKQRSGKNKRR